MIRDSEAVKLCYCNSLSSDEFGEVPNYFAANIPSEERPCRDFCTISRGVSPGEGIRCGLSIDEGHSNRETVEPEESTEGENDQEQHQAFADLVQANYIQNYTKRIVIVDDIAEPVSIPWMKCRDLVLYEPSSHVSELGRRIINYFYELDFPVFPKNYDKLDVELGNIIFAQINTTHKYKSVEYTVSFEFTYRYKRRRTDLDPTVTFEELAEYLQNKIFSRKVLERTEARLKFYYDLISLELYIGDLQLEM